MNTNSDLHMDMQRFSQLITQAPPEALEEQWLNRDSLIHSWLEQAANGYLKAINITAKRYKAEGKYTLGYKVMTPNRTVKLLSNGIVEVLESLSGENHE